MVYLQYSLTFNIPSIFLEYILNIPSIAAEGADAAARQTDERNTPFTDCISAINNTQIDNAKDLDVVMPMCNLIEYSDNYSKTSESLWQYYRDKLMLILQILNYSNLK